MEYMASFSVRFIWSISVKSFKINVLPISFGINDGSVLFGPPPKPDTNDAAVTDERAITPGVSDVDINNSDLPYPGGATTYIQRGSPSNWLEHITANIQRSTSSMSW